MTTVPMFRRVAPLLLAGVALWQWGRWARRRRQGVQPRPQEETTWEGEGGALPDTGAQLGPEPSSSR